jgi:uncharacterized PurR-regulated membrane protein YhhQ (DUF165 family)
MIYIILYLAAIVAANLIVVRFGPSSAIIVAFLFIGLDLTTRDYLHDAWRGKHLWWKMLLLIATGSALSWFLNREAGQIALASFVAFAGAGLADTLVYWLLGEKSRLLRINGSNVVSAGVDSFLFPSLAFGWPPLWGIVLGQFVAKVGGGFIWSLILNLRRGKANET